METKIFISYSSVDDAIAQKISKKLEDIGIVVFLDRKDIKWGDSVTGKIEEGLGECSAVIVIISPASLKSHWVPYEVGFAKSLGKKILPFLTHPSIDLPGYLNELHYKTKISDIAEYLKKVFEPKKETTKNSKKKVTPKERDKIRSERNELLINEMNRKEGILNCSVFQLDDHTDKGYLLNVKFDDDKTNAADVLSLIRQTITELFPDLPYWGEMITESENSVGFGYSYIDEYNKIFK